MSELCILPLDSIVESTYNPRSSFDAAKLQELADSIRTSGLHQPILVRRLPGDRIDSTDRGVTHEIVAGARRFRASRIAGQKDIAAIVRFMSDDTAMEVAILENLQRDDLSALEEAEGYERLMQHSSLTAEAVGAKIGKSKSYVYARLKLTALHQAGRDALREGKIDASKALLIARIPDEKLQAKALEFCTVADYYGTTRGYRQCAEHIQREFMLRLDAARFKITDPTLVEGRPACPDCPLRTGFEPELFADVKSADTCTLPSCFHAKEAAHDARLLKAANDRGQTVIVGKEARQIMPSEYKALAGFKRLDDVRDAPGKDTLRKLLKAQMKERGIVPVLLANPHKDGAMMEVLPNAVVAELLVAAGEAQGAETIERASRGEAQEALRKANAAAHHKLETKWREAAVTECAARLVNRASEPVPADVLRVVAVRIAGLLTAGPSKVVAQLLGIGTVASAAGICEHIENAQSDPAHLLRLVAMADELEVKEWLRAEDQRPDAITANAAALGVDLEALRASLKADQKAEEKAKAQRAAAKAEKEAAKLQKASEATSSAALARDDANGMEPGESRKKPRGKKASPAAQAEAPKTSAAHASAQIAAALQAAGEPDPGAATATQDDEAHPRLRADAAPSAQAATPTTLSSTPAWPFPTASNAKKTATSTVANTDKAEIATAPAKREVQPGLPAGFAIRQRVEISEHVGGGAAKYRGRMAFVERLPAADTPGFYWVLVTGKNGSMGRRTVVHEADLIAVEA